KEAATFVEQLVRDLDDAKERTLDVASGDGVRTCIGLLASAMTDAVATVPLANRILRNGPPDARTAAALVMSQLGLRSALEALVAALGDADVRVAWLAFGSLQWTNATVDAFDELLELAARLPEAPRDVGPFVFAGATQQVGRAPVIAAAIR